MFGGMLADLQLTQATLGDMATAIDAAARVIAERLHIRRAVAILESRAVVVPTLIVLFVTDIVCSIKAAIAAHHGEDYRFPLTLELIK